MRTLQPTQAHADRDRIPRPPRGRETPRNSGLRLLPRSHHVVEEGSDEQHREQAENDRPDGRDRGVGRFVDQPHWILWVRGVVVDDGLRKQLVLLRERGLLFPYAIAKRQRRSIADDSDGLDVAALDVLDRRLSATFGTEGVWDRYA